ncbi:acyltransferase [Paenibacillus abyssi]|uniref:Acetyltransferase n=1 Tax=Paenibacillus abyssi TaxID=1340531 RepID=A0A917CUY6_9BACL|nr:acyltransferase [Paenibacillus abyssi]GGF98548.1 hypothetical protein GCM10010916_14740 [Paenibacillus abyssi]
MRGRDLFAKYQPMLRLIIKIMGLLPKALLKWMWTLSDLLPELLGVALRYCLLKNLAGRCGDNVVVGRGVELRYAERLTVGSNVSIHKQCYLDAYGELFIDDEVSIAHQTSIVSFQHTWGEEGLPIRDNPLLCAPIRIRKDVWIGCGVRIMAGVDIGSRSVVAAGAVVTRSIPSGVVAAGVPAKLVKQIRPEPEPDVCRQSAIAQLRQESV